MSPSRGIRAQRFLEAWICTWSAACAYATGRANGPVLRVLRPRRLGATLARRLPQEWRRLIEDDTGLPRDRRPDVSSAAVVVLSPDDLVTVAAGLRTSLPRVRWAQQLANRAFPSVIVHASHGEITAQAYRRISRIRLEDLRPQLSPRVYEANLAVLQAATDLATGMIRPRTGTLAGKKHAKKALPPPKIHKDGAGAPSPNGIPAPAPPPS